MDKTETEEKAVNAKHIIEYVSHLKTSRENLFDGVVVLQQDFQCAVVLDLSVNHSDRL